MKPLKSNPAPVEAHNVTAAEFISALFPAEAIGVAKPELGQPCVVVSTPWRPDGAAEPLWPPKAYLPRSKQNDELYVNWSTCQAVEHKHTKGKRAGETSIEPRCTNDAFHAQHLLMLDDVGNGDKSVLSPDDERVKNATYLLETSVGNYQVGYKLAEPLNFEQSARLRSALSAAGLGDPGSLKTPHRWCRVPGSVNMKPSKGGWRSRLAHWSPERVFTIDEIAAMFGLDLDAAGVSKQLQKAEIPDDESAYTDAHFRWMQSLPVGDPGSIIGERRGTGFYPIVCPWSDQHDATRPNPEDGTAYRPGYRNSPPAFRCHHSHGKDATTGNGEHGTREFLSWCSRERQSQLTAALGTLTKEQLDEREEAKRIGDGVEDDEAAATTLSAPMTLAEMLDNFVYLIGTDEVCDLRNPRYAFRPGHFLNLTASSRMPEPTTGKKVPKSAPVAKVWMMAEGRRQVDARTWRPGHGRFTFDPEGRSAVNIWTARVAEEPPADWKSLASVFFDHVEFLVPVPDERARFLDWLAHVEQRPGEIVHHHYLHVTREKQGIGRNAMAAYLARVWSGNVALSVDMIAALSNGFNGRLSQKFLAVVDELHEGMHGAGWKFGEKMKSLLTEPVRAINPKYGKQHDEYNVMRWLMFSNHIMALPLSAFDRRLNVIENPSEPRDAGYYKSLYGQARDPAVIASVRHAFRTRNIERFNPGEVPPLSAAKAQMIEASRSDEDARFEELKNSAPSDLILLRELRRELLGYDAADDTRAQSMVRAILVAGGGAPHPVPVKFEGKAHRVAVLRNRDKWLQETSSTRLVAELDKWRLAREADPRNHLGHLAGIGR